MDFNNFESLNIFEKLEMGIVSTMQYFMFNFNIIYVLFTSILVIKVLKNNKNVFYRAISFYPLIMGIIFSIPNIAPAICPVFFDKMNCINVQDALIIKDRLLSIMPFLVICFNYIAIIISIYAALGKKSSTLICIIAFMARSMYKTYDGIYTKYLCFRG